MPLRVTRLYEALEEEVSPVREETVLVFAGATLEAGGVREFTVHSTGKHSALAVTVRAAYDSNASKGVAVRWLHSPDGVIFDSPEDAESVGNYDELTFSAGEVRQRTLLVPMFKPYVRVQLVNLDPSYPATVSAWRTLVR